MTLTIQKQYDYMCLLELSTGLGDKAAAFTLAECHQDRWL